MLQVNDGNDTAPSLSSYLHRHPLRLAAASAALYFVTALLIRGRMHSDEIFQVLEPAHRIAFGYGLSAWEWAAGIRNWAVPGLMSLPLLLSRLLGLDDPRVYTSLVWAGCAALQGLATLALYRLVEERDNRDAAAFAAIVHATWGAFAIYAARPLSDGLSVAPLIGALLWAQRARAGGGPARAGFFAGALLGLAFVVRYPSAVFGFPLAVSLLAARRWRALATFCAGVALVVGALTALDFATWGGFSAWSYTKFNVLSGSSTQFGTRPWWWYATILPGMAPQPLLYHFGKGLRRRDLVLSSFVFYLLVISALAHKEARFLVPILPLFVVIAAAPAVETWKRLRSRTTKAFLVVAYAACSIIVATVGRPIATHADLLDAHLAAGRDPALTGLVLTGTAWYTAGGYYALHREVPMRDFEGGDGDEQRAAFADPRYSHVLVYHQRTPPEVLVDAGFVLWKRFGKAEVWRRADLSDGSVATAPSSAP